MTDFVSSTGTNTYSTLESMWYENISPYNWLYIKLNNMIRFQQILCLLLFRCGRFSPSLQCLRVFISYWHRYLAIMHNFSLLVIVTCDLLIHSVKIQARLLQNIIGFPWLILRTLCFETNLAQLHPLTIIVVSIWITIKSVIPFFYLPIVMVISIPVFVFLCITIDT